MVEILPPIFAGFGADFFLINCSISLLMIMLQQSDSFANPFVKKNMLIVKWKITSTCQSKNVKGIVIMQLPSGTVVGI